MTQTSLPKWVLFYALSILMAVALGFVLASPTDFLSFLVVAMVLMVLATPVLMRWHHAILIFSIKATLMIFFLPGQPYLWMLMAVLSLSFAILRRTLEKESSFIHVPSSAYALVALAIVILVTAKLTGGIGFRALGSGVYGGKRYYTTLAAVLVYFALVSQRIPVAKAGFFVSLFLLSELTALFSNIAYVLGPKFWFLYAVFPSDLAIHQAVADFSVTQSSFSRITGLSLAGQALFCFMLNRYGARGIFTSVWRLGLFLAVIGITMMGGFRSYVVLFALLLAIQFKLERLYRSRIFLVLVGVLALSAILILPNTTRLPLSVQRSLSILPFIKVAPAAAWNAQATSEWRLKMWQLLLPQVPKYFWVGKGFAVDPVEMYLVQESVDRGLAQSYELAITTGNYHNGPLSIVLPFGIWGILAFAWFCWAGIRVLYRNWRHGPAELQSCNTLFLSYFLTKLLFFIIFYGAIEQELVSFTSVVGLSISLNGGVCQAPAPVRSPVPVQDPAALPLPSGV